MMAETCYQVIEKLAFALVMAPQRLRPYFPSHQVIVKMDRQIKQVLRKPDLVGRTIVWSVEVSKLGLKYEPRGPL